MYNEEMIENVREYLNEYNDVAIDCIQSIGYGDWCEVYSLYDLYRDHCNGELDEVINLFVDSGMNATSYYRYYVTEDGEVKDEDDMCYDIEEFLKDDDMIEEIIEDINNWNVNVPDELLEMCKEEEPVTLEDVHNLITDAYDFHVSDAYCTVKNTDGVDYFKTACNSVATLTRICDSLISITSRCSEDKYAELNEYVWINIIPKLIQFCGEFCKGGVTVEKAVEVWVNKNILEG